MSRLTHVTRTVSTEAACRILSTATVGKRHWTTHYSNNVPRSRTVAFLDGAADGRHRRPVRGATGGVPGSGHGGASR
jgi:hypothetical protein